jgi:hypothetical protein
VPVEIQVTDAPTLALLRASGNPWAEVHCEILGMHGQFLKVFAMPATAPGLPGVLVDIPPAEIDSVVVKPDSNVIVVNIRRTLPLSSSQGGQPFRFGFAFGSGVVALSSCFTVLAKQGKIGASIKPPKPVPIEEENPGRRAAKDAIAAEARRQSGREVVVSGQLSSAAAPRPAPDPRSLPSSPSANGQRKLKLSHHAVTFPPPSSAAAISPQAAGRFAPPYNTRPHKRSKFFADIGAGVEDAKARNERPPGLPNAFGNATASSNVETPTDRHLPPPPMPSLAFSALLGTESPLSATLPFSYADLIDGDHLLAPLAGESLPSDGSLSASALHVTFDDSEDEEGSSGSKSG